MLQLHIKQDYVSVNKGDAHCSTDILLLFSLSQKSGVKLAPIPFYFFLPSSSSRIQFHCHLLQPSPLFLIPRSHSPFHHTLPQISLHAVLSSQSLSSSSPSTLHSKCIRSLRQPSPSICSMCPAHFNRLLITFQMRLSFTPTSSRSSSIVHLSILFTPTILLTQSFSQTCICCSKKGESALCEADP